MATTIPLTNDENEALRELMGGLLELWPSGAVADIYLAIRVKLCRAKRGLFHLTAIEAYECLWVLQRAIHNSYPPATRRAFLRTLAKLRGCQFSEA